MPNVADPQLAKCCQMIICTSHPCTSFNLSQYCSFQKPDLSDDLCDCECFGFQALIVSKLRMPFIMFSQS